LIAKRGVLAYLFLLPPASKLNNVVQPILNCNPLIKVFIENPVVPILPALPLRDAETPVLPMFNPVLPPMFTRRKNRKKVNEFMLFFLYNVKCVQLVLHPVYGILKNS
jgi:hypothetical protein